MTGTELMKLNNKQKQAISLEGINIKQTETFTYLGNLVSKEGESDEDIKCRTDKARFASNSLRTV